MLHSKQIPEIPCLTDFNHFAWYCALREDNYELLTLAKIEGGFPELPKNFLPPSYALELVVKGTIKGIINNKTIELTPNSCIFLLEDNILREAVVSEDCEFYVIGFTTQFANALNIQLPQSQLAQLLIHPSWQITEEQMDTALQYISLLRTLIEQNKPLAVLNMVRSFVYFLSYGYAIAPQNTYSITRAEQICGEFLSLVEAHCRKYHMVEWYASQLNIAPKYLSNVVKQAINTSPNACIDDALTRQAKSLLSYTSLSIQQIADVLGFQNQSHFGTFFKRQTDLSPKAFRNTIP